MTKGSRALESDGESGGRKYGKRETKNEIRILLRVFLRVYAPPLVATLANGHNAGAAAYRILTPCTALLTFNLNSNKHTENITNAHSTNTKSEKKLN